MSHPVLLWQKISSLGIQPSQPDWLQRKIMLSNQLAFSIWSLNLIFGSMVFVVTEGRILVPVIVFFLGILILGFNALRWHIPARWLFAVVPILALTVNLGMITPPAWVPYVPGRVLMLALISVPLVLFDLREPWHLGGSVGLVVFLLFAVVPMSDQFRYEDPSRWIDPGMPILHYAVFTLSSGILIIAFIYQQSITLKAEQRVQLLLAEVREANAELHGQLEIIERQNHELTDSITYARRIQEAILPSDQKMNRVLPRHFVLNLPRDIVSGDFYWASEVDGKQIVAAVDCTGHGVPGAFMSVLGSSLLNRIVEENRTTDPSEILQMLNLAVQINLNQLDPDSRSFDGMDMALCVIDPQRQVLTYAGAQNPLYFIRDGKLEITKATKWPVGGGQDCEKIYVSHEIPYLPGDLFWIFSDGFADQFGGPEGRKFMYRQLKNLITELHAAPLEEQHRRLEAVFLQWRGSLPQVDDVLVIGVRL